MRKSAERSEAPRRTPPRATAVCRFADLRETDHVLDVGCGAGKVALEVARLVEHVHGFDVSPARVAEASRSAAERRAENATFESMSIRDFPFEPLSWDVTLFMRVWGKSAGTTNTVGEGELARILSATRRQLVMMAGKHLEEGFAEILDVCDRCQFDVLCFARPNLILANRRGADVRVGGLPGLALVPTAWLLDHPITRTSSWSSESRRHVQARRLRYR